MNKLKLTTLAMAIGLALSASAMGGTLSEAQYKKAGEAITATHRSDQAACQEMAGNTRDVCMAKANGRETVAKAERESAYRNSSKNRYYVSIAKADAAFAIAKEKCDDLAGNAQDVCRKEAQSAEVAAKAEAERVQKTADATATARDTAAEASKASAASTQEAAYAVAKEKCDALVGDAQSTCLTQAKAQHGAT